MTPEGMIACRDPLGIRPLVMGKLGDAVIFASETVALDVVGADFVRAVDPGELVIVQDGEVASAPPVRARRAAPVHLRIRLFLAPRFDRRRPLGLFGAQGDRRAARDRSAGRRRPRRARCPIRACPPRSAMRRQSGIPFELGIIRSHYVGRTFIQPGDQVRHLGVKLKHNANRALIEGKRVVLVDDSIVRGTTSLKIVQMMREAGAAEVHMRIASPPTRHSCFYGVDTPERVEAARREHGRGGDDALHPAPTAWRSSPSTACTRRWASAAAPTSARSYCDACFTGDYPTTLTDQDDGVPVDQFALLAERVG